MMVNASYQPETPTWCGPEPPELSTGTTLVAMEFADGVVMGADSRTSDDSFYSSVTDRFADKLTPVTSHIMTCSSGLTADAQAMTEIVKNQLEWYENEFENPPSVHTAAHIFKNISYDGQLTAELIIAGWDKDNGGQVYSVPIRGALMRQAASIVGSGSTFLYGFIDANYKQNMKKDECVELAKKAVTLAINRDGSSGGCCRIAIITKDGIERKLFLNNELDAIDKVSY